MPEQVQELFKQQEVERLERLEAFGHALGKKRQDAIAGRASSGIETIWLEDEEAYEGIDEATGGTIQDKPRSASGDSSYRGRANNVMRSTVFLNITRPYVDAASAKVSEMLLPTDDRNWGIKPTPIPELSSASKKSIPIMGLDGFQKDFQTQNPDGSISRKPMTVGDFALQAMKEATEKAERAEKRIDDWLIECQYHAEVRKVIEDAAKLGTGILKGPVPTRKKRKVVVSNDQDMAIEIHSAIVPTSKRVDPWNFYPDPTCGECIHNGSYVFERDELTGKQLKDLKDIPGYEASQIDEALREGPGMKMANRLGRTDTQIDKEKFEVWYFYGLVEKNDLKLSYKKAEEHDCEKIPAIITMVNDRVIKAAVNPLDSGEFPYDVMTWQRRANDWTGIGVARHIRTPQRMLNAATRNMMDNAGLSAGPQIIMRRNVVEPADGRWEISPRKLWFVNEEVDMRSVNDAIMSINIESKQAELMGIIQFAQKMAEDVTGLPILMQGQQGAAPETVGGMQMLFNNASTVLRRIARLFDDNITEPHIRRYYEWLMIYGDDPEEKGDFSIDARGSTALVERDIQNQALIQLGAFVADPEYGIDKRKWFMEVTKAQRLDPRKFTIPDEELEQRMQQMAQAQPQDPRVVAAQASIQTAQIRAESDVQRESIQAQTDMQELEFRRETQALDNQARMQELMMQREIEIMKLAQQQNVSVATIKAQLADTAMKLRTQKEMQDKEIAVKREQGSGI